MFGDFQLHYHFLKVGNFEHGYRKSKPGLDAWAPRSTCHWCARPSSAGRPRGVCRPIQRTDAWVTSLWTGSPAVDPPPVSVLYAASTHTGTTGDTRRMPRLTARRTRVVFHAGFGLKKASMAPLVTSFLSFGRSFVPHHARSSAPPCAPPRVRRTSRALPGAEGGHRRAKLCSHFVALPLLLVLLNTPSSSLVHLAAPASTRPSRSGRSRPAPPPAPDDTAPGPTSTPNRPVHVRNGFQACSPAYSSSEPPPASSSSPETTTLCLPRSFQGDFCKPGTSA
jgi:hypothetical protein